MSTRSGDLRCCFSSSVLRSRPTGVRKRNKGQDDDDFALLLLLHTSMHCVFFFFYCANSPNITDLSCHAHDVSNTPYVAQHQENYIDRIPII